MATGKVLPTARHKSAFPPVKYNAVKRLRFVGPLMRSGPELEPCGGILGRIPIPRGLSERGRLSRMLGKVGAKHAQSRS